MQQDLEKYGENELTKLSRGRNHIQAYKRRWLIMFIFIYYNCMNAAQWTEYSSITHIVVKYYKVSSVAVDWTSTVYMAIYPVLVVPASYLIDKKGLRTAGLIGCVGTLIGTAVKVFSTRQDLFWLVLSGQAILAISQLVILCLPPKLAATWFKATEVSTACSLGVFGNQMGCALGYIISPLMIKDSDNIDEIGAQLKVLTWLLTGLMVPVTIAVLIYFPNEPPLPPSNAQALLRQNKERFETKIFFTSIKKLFNNKGFVIHMIAYSLNIGVFYAVGTLLVQFIVQYIEDTVDAGWMGFVIIIFGMMGSIIFGVVLDKTHKYKEITLLIYFCSAVGLTCFMITLKYQMRTLTYIFSAVFGLFINAYIPVGFELAMELTFPSEESTTSGILTATAQLAGAILAVFLGYFNQSFGGFWSLCTQSILLFLGTFITIFVPNNLLRQEAFTTNRDLIQK